MELHLLTKLITLKFMLNNMKNIFKLLFLLPLAFVSCGEDEDDFVEQNYLVGKWEISEVGATNPQGVILYQDYVNNSECKDNYIFNEDFTFESNDYTTDVTCASTSIEGTYDRLSTNVTLNYTTLVDGNSQSVSRSFSIISLTFSDVVIAYTNDLNQIVYLKLQKV